MINTYSIHPAPPVPTVFWIFVSPFPGPISYLSPIFHLLTPLLSLLSPDSTSPIYTRRGATVHLDGAPTRRPAPLVCNSLPLRADWGVSHTSLWPPSLIPLPHHCHPWPATRFMSAPEVLLYEGPFLPLPASIIYMPFPYPSGLDRRPSPLKVPSG